MTKNKEKLDEAILFTISWLDQYAHDTDAFENVMRMCFQVYEDVKAGRKTNGDYHDNQCYLHGLLTSI